MRILTGTVNSVIALLAAQVLCSALAHAQGSVVPDLKEEVSRQDAIYRTKEEGLLESYVVNRSLASYAETLPADFARTLEGLGAQDRWLDVGAGEGDAILDYCAPKSNEGDAKGRQQHSGKASAVALSIEDRRSARWHQTAVRLGHKQIQYFFGRPFRKYSAQELGKFQIVTDLQGGFSYTTDLDGYMEKALDVLVTGGNLYTLLQDVHSEDGRNKPYYPGSPYLTELTNADGTELKICTWLKAISCTQVTCEIREEWKPPIEIYHVRKVCDDVSVPALAAVHFIAGTPPERRFAVKNAVRVLPDAAR